MLKIFFLILLIFGSFALQGNTFSVAEYYRQIGEKGLALDWYQQKVREGGTKEEIFCSTLHSALLLRAMGLPQPAVIETLWRAHQMEPGRSEPIYYLAEMYDEMGNPAKAYECLHSAEHFSIPNYALSEMGWIDDYGLHFKKGLIAFWVGNYQESVEECDITLAYPHLPENWRMQAKVNRQFAAQQLDLATASNTHEEAPQPNKSVLIAILARNKAHVLPTYLRCIENFDYDKKLISIYINTNNNSDATLEIAEKWAEENEGKYARVIFENHSLDGLPETTPHDWPNERLSRLAIIRDKSLRLTHELGCDYYFVADCDTFLAPCTLKELIKKELPIVAPMVRGVPETNDWFSNFFYKIDENGFWDEARSQGFYPFFKREVLGTIAVDLVHVAYLIRADVIDQIGYTREDGNYVNEWEYQTLARTARESHVDQFICNEKDFGTTLRFPNMGKIPLEVEASFMTLQKERDLDQYLDNFTLYMQNHLSGLQ